MTSPTAQSLALNIFPVTRLALLMRLGRHLGQYCRCLICHGLELSIANTTRTWPTTYVAYSNFGFETHCASSAATPVPLVPYNLDVSRLIFSANDELQQVGQKIEAYINNFTNNLRVTGLDKCTFVVNLNGGSYNTTRRGLNDVQEWRSQSLMSSEAIRSLRPRKGSSSSTQFHYTNTTFYNNTGPQNSVPVRPPPHPVPSKGGGGTQGNTKVTTAVLTSVVITPRSSTLPQIPTRYVGGLAQVPDPSPRTSIPPESDRRSQPGPTQGGSNEGNGQGYTGNSEENDQGYSDNSEENDQGSTGINEGNGPGDTGNGNSAPVLTFGGSAIVANPSGAFVLGPGETLQPGGPALKVSGTILSLASGGTIAMINGATHTLVPNSAAQTAVPVVTVNNQVFTASISGSQTSFVFGPGQTLTAGGIITISGRTFSLPATGSFIIVNGQTSTLGFSNPSITAPPVLTVNGQPITASVSGFQTSFILGPGTTLTPGGSIIVSGTTYSLPASTSGVVVINGKTSTLGTGAITATPTLTINGQTYTPIISNGQTMYIIAPGTTLTPGGVVTISGTRISMDSSGTALVFGSITSTIPNMPKSTSAKTTTSSSTTSGTGSTATNSLEGTHKAGAGRMTANEITGLLICVAGFLVEIFGILS